MLQLYTGCSYLGTPKNHSMEYNAWYFPGAKGHVMPYLSLTNLLDEVRCFHPLLGGNFPQKRGWRSATTEIHHEILKTDFTEH